MSRPFSRVAAPAPAPVAASSLAAASAAAAVAAPAPSLAAELEEELRLRVARPTARVARLRGELVFAAGTAGTFTVRFGRGEPSLRRGRARLRRPLAILTADARTMLEVVTGRTVGVDAFLRGQLNVRGNLALPLELDDLLHPATRDVRAPRCHRVEAAGIESFYLEAGPADAPPVLLLHGLGATSASFLPTIWDLSKDHRIIAVDLPGFGETDKPLRPLHAPYFASWLLALLDRLGLSRVHLVGNSMGGRIALEVALRAPERVDRLVLLAPSMAWRRFRFAAGLVRVLRPEIALLPLPAKHVVVMRVLRSMFARPERVPVPALHAAADEFLRVFAGARGRIAFFNAMREIYLEDPYGRRGFWDRLPALARPSLFVFGDRDWLVPARLARFVAEALPTARCETFADSGHVPQYEHPERTNALIRAFLAE